MAKSTKATTIPIEEKLKRLEEIGGLLDRGTLPLEEQLQVYEEGMVLAKECREYIEQAQARVTKLSGEIPEQGDVA